jgi:ubiquinone/menaquinone biosynthesis C-methylase UbiE
MGILLCLCCVKEFDSEIVDYYSSKWEEDARLRSGLDEIELLRTQEIVRRFLPDGGLRILDVGGGGGVHAEWLLADGHEVHLVDPVSRHVESAMSRLGNRDGFTCESGDARSLTQEDDSADAVLLLGPLYHLTEHEDRVRAWSEAFRVTKPGGLVFAAAISRFAALASGLRDGLIFDAEFQSLTRRTLKDGQHRSPEGRDFFTTAFFHLPEELKAEAEATGWSVQALLGVEGFTMLMPQLEEHWNDANRRALIVEMARVVESEPSLLGMGPHILLVGGKS